MRKLTNYLLGLVVMMALSTFVSCDKDKTDPIDPPTPSFTAEVATDFSGTVTFTNTTIGADTYVWEFGDETGTSVEENPVYSYNESGTYTVTLTAFNAGGENSVTSEISVATEVPNLASSAEKDWIALPGDLFTGTVTFTENGGMHFDISKAWTQAGIYTTIEVEAGKTYSIDMNVEATVGLTDGWFEVFADYVAPDGSEYISGGHKRSINTWDGCGNEPFNDLISVAGCNDEKNIGTFIATETGTVYLVIRGGAADFGEGVVVSNITFAEVLFSDN